MKTKTLNLISLVLITWIYDPVTGCSLCHALAYQANTYGCSYESSLVRLLMSCIMFVSIVCFIRGKNWILSIYFIHVIHKLKDPGCHPPSPAPLKRIFSAEFVSMFMNCLHLEFQMVSCSVSVFIIIKPKDKYSTVPLVQHPVRQKLLLCGTW